MAEAHKGSIKVRRGSSAISTARLAAAVADRYGSVRRLFESARRLQVRKALVPAAAAVVDRIVVAVLADPTAATEAITAVKFLLG
jgi:hypothetical protein